MLETTVKSGLVNELQKIVGSEFVSTNQADLYIYSYDMTQAEPSWPDIISKSDLIKFGKLQLQNLE